MTNYREALELLAAANASPAVPAVAPGDQTYQPCYERHDCLRRIPDLLVGDLIAFGGHVREVERVGSYRHKPGECFLRLVDDGHDDIGRPIVRTFRDETKVRVLESHWMAPQDEEASQDERDEQGG